MPDKQLKISYEDMANQHEEDPEIRSPNHLWQKFADRSLIKDSDASLSIKQYDFHRPEKLSRDQIRRIKTCFEGVPRYISNYLAGILKRRIEMEIYKVEQEYYRECFQKKLSPTIKVAFNIEGQVAGGMIELPADLFYDVVEMLFGGEGGGEIPDRNISLFERNLAREYCKNVLSFHRNALQKLSSAGFTITHVETDPLMIPKTLSLNDVLVKTTYETTIDDKAGFLGISFPYNFMGPLFRKSHSPKAVKSDNKSRFSKERISRTYGGISIPLSVEFARKKIHAGMISKLAPGAVFMLDHPTSLDLNVVVNGKLKFMAKPGVKGNRLGVKITRTIEDEE